MAAKTEIELKLTLRERDYHVLRHWFRAARAKSTATANTYFETPDEALRRRGAGLRLRLKARGPATLTLKFPVAAKSVKAGVHRRGEFEKSVSRTVALPTTRGKRPIARLLPRKLPFDLPEELRDALVPLGTLRLKRLHFNADGVEYALDCFRLPDKTVGYELEAEGDDLALARKRLRQIFRTFEIPWKPEKKTKLARFFASLA